jgi:hypothetical protein
LTPAAHPGPSGGRPSAGGSAREFVLVVMRVAVGAQVEFAPFGTTCVNRMEECSAALAPSLPADDLLQMLLSNLWSAMIRADPNNVGVNGRS